ncbi:MAG TPA: SDR family oxidoreductase [Acidobacteria bacterium]|nr:SDR family oxidoreductase [Acidobacteriota bacterium]
MDLALDGRSALVCGASAGLGFATARELAQEGAQVVIVSRSEERLDRAAAAIRKETGGTVHPVAADLTDPETPRRIVAECSDRFGCVDILVANGGGPPSMPATEAGSDDLEAACRLLLLPVQRLVAACLPGMRRRRWGRIVAITSIAVREPQPGLVLSNALRAAVTGYLKSVADEVAADGVTVNTVLPGFTATERLGELAGTLASREGTTEAAVLDGWAARTPMGRLLEPAEVAAAVAFLVSDRASGMTGVALPVDGGFGRGLL